MHQASLGALTSLSKNRFLSSFNSDCDLLRPNILP
jgi:hypothetical protein